MRRIKSANTKPELIVRRIVHAMGFRYRLHQAGLPGKPDLTFAGRGKIIFVHGCFWHDHEDPACPDRGRPKSNTGYWGPKLARNKARDRQTQDALTAAGWQVLVVWDCETRDLATLAARLESFLRL